MRSAFNFGLGRGMRLSRVQGGTAFAMGGYIGLQADVQARQPMMHEFRNRMERIDLMRSQRELIYDKLTLNHAQETHQFSILRAGE